VVEVEYDTERFDETTVRGLLTDLEAVLVRGAEPGVPVAALTVRSRTVAAHEAPTHRPAPLETAASDGISDVVRVWQDVLGVAVEPHDDFFALGGYSLQVLEIVSAVERLTGTEIDITEWLDEPTPARLTELAAPRRAPTAPSASGHRVARHGAPGAPWLHLVHGAGVDQLSYRKLVEALPAQWRITVSEDEGGETIEDIAERYLERLRGAERMPDLLGGWSIGGLVAYAMIIRLQGEGAGCPPLVLLDSPVPGVGEVRTGPTAFADAVLRGAQVTPPSRLHLGDDLQLGFGVLSALLRAAGKPASADTLRTRFELDHRHRTAASAYRGEGKVTVPVLLVAADLDDQQVTDWSSRISGDLKVVRVQHDHYSLLREPTVAEIIAQFR
jgi:thioesterase domain-containing protein/acyl carrier protein